MPSSSRVPRESSLPSAPRGPLRILLACLASLAGFALGLTARAQTNPILFVTQVPIPADFTSITATFGNHRPDLDACGRGGDLWIRYPDGTLRNLTRTAGFGRQGDQSTNGIAVRDPSVHWDGRRALFSMVIGAPRRRYDYDSVGTWQIYEITNFLDPSVPPVITRVPNQPAGYNNISPVYTTDDQILFTTDRPRSGEAHLYPQRDEYEEAPTVTGLWKLNPTTGDLRLLTHTPSGAFSPGIDSFGRVIFIRWDHLQRDQQADADALEAPGQSSYGTFNYTSERPDSVALPDQRQEVFPETRLGTATVGGFVFNQFFPWQINEDGTEEETLNHVGRHELGGSYRSSSFRDDSNLGELYFFGNKFNTNTLNNLLQIRESSAQPGLYYGIDAPEFGTHAAGQIVTLDGPPSLNPDRMRVRYLTPRVTAFGTGDGEPVPADHSGLYRNPLPLADGSLIAVHTAETRADRNDGSTGAPISRYDFRLKRLAPSANGFFTPSTPLTPGIRQSVRYWSPDEQVVYTDVLMWELDPVEVRPRTRPTPTRPHLPGPELAAFEAEGMDVAAFQRVLESHDLGLIVGRDVTTRDRADFQQPFNLRVPGGVQSVGAGGKVYDVTALQIFQADLIRGLGLVRSNDTPRPGRRVLAQPMHDRVALPAHPTTPGAVELGADGSFAALVPARRALSWQLVNGTEPVVRERYWITVQPGEIRTCTSCHGINTADQAGRIAPTNSPQALRTLLSAWKRSRIFPAPASDAAQPRFIALVRDESGQAYFKASVAPERPVTVEGSQDLKVWSPVTSGTAPLGIFEFQVPRTDPARFYRVRQ
jgi:hypothetical protein